MTLPSKLINKKKTKWHLNSYSKYMSIRNVSKRQINKQTNNNKPLKTIRTKNYICNKNFSKYLNEIILEPRKVSNPAPNLFT